MGSDDRPENEVLIFEGRFSWWAAWCMMIWVICFILSTLMTVLSTRGAAFKLESEEISFINAAFPPYGNPEQPDPSDLSRQINKPFRYLLPQTALFYSLAASSFGLFTVSYFTSFILLEDQGSKRVVDIGTVISKGVQVYLSKTMPIICAFLLLGGWYVFVTAGWKALVCFVAGACLNLLSARVGVGSTVQGQTRLAHALSHELFDSLQIGIRAGSIGGLLATSLGLGGMAGMWLFIRDTVALSGFGTGAAIVSFHLRVGGGIFSKGADIGAELVGEIYEFRAEEETALFQLQTKMASVEAERKERAKRGMEGDDEEMMNKLKSLEQEMQDVPSQMHPIDYLDAVGENICDVSGTCADLFESMVLILSTCAIIGTRGTPLPHFNSGLPFWIAATGMIGCSFVAYYCHAHERFTSRQLRWSLRFNLITVMVIVQTVQVLVSLHQWQIGNLTFTQFWHYCAISLAGQLGPEICVLFAEYFTSTDYTPVKSLALNSDLGVVQVVLQGFGQGFLSTSLPSALMIVIILFTWQLESHYGLALLSASSVSGTGFQGGIASYGAIATNAHKIVHLTTYHSMARHRANICAALGDSTAHAGNTISIINAFNTVFNVVLTLLAMTYTHWDQNYMEVDGPLLSNYSQGGLVTGIVLTFLFCGNTMIACLDTSRGFQKICQTNTDVQRISRLPFPQSHIKPFKTLTGHGSILAVRMIFSPMINTLAVPLIGGYMLGVKGLLYMISGSNVLILCLSTLLINSGQSWVAARKFVLFGLLKDADGNVIGPESVHNRNLLIGESIGGPLEDTTGPAMNNFIKFVAVFAFVTGGPAHLYEEEPTTTWWRGILVVICSTAMVAFGKVCLDVVIRVVKDRAERRRRRRAYEEGDTDEVTTNNADEDEFDTKL